MWIVYLNLFWAYLKIGLFGFGGGYAMLSLIQHEAVEVVNYRESLQWLAQKDFPEIVAYLDRIYRYRSYFSNDSRSHRNKQCYLCRICSCR